MKIRSFLPGRRAEEISGLGNPSVDLIAAIVSSVDGSTASGVSVTPLKAFRLAAVYACVKAIAGSIASLPIDVTQADSSNGREYVLNDPRLGILNEFPNPEQTGMELFENWIAHALLWGTGYLYIQKNKGGQPIELWPMRPDVTEPRRSKDAGRLYYYTELPDGSPQNVPAENVIPLNAILGRSPVTTARDTIAGAAAAEQYASRFWSNNARPGGLIELPESMEEEEMDDWMRRWKAGHEGLKRAQLIGILSGGATWKEVSINPQAAQFLETRQYATRDIARLYGVPPHRIGDLEGTVNRASLEQQSIEFVTYTLREWMVRAEQALRTKLFATKADRAADRKPRFNFLELMRGDMRARYEAYAVGVQWGFLNRADVRRKEGEPTVGAEHLLDEFLVPLNMIPASKLNEVEPGNANKNVGDKNKDGGGTQPTTGSDGSTPQETKALRAMQVISELTREHPELADRIELWAEERANMRALERGSIDADDVIDELDPVEQPKQIEPAPEPEPEAEPESE